MKNGPREKELRQQIENLPKGNITYKTIRGMRRMYLQWTEEGKRKSVYVKAEDEQSTVQMVLRRKALEEELRSLKYQYEMLPEADAGFVHEAASVYRTYETRVVTGKELHALVSGVSAFDCRECFRDLKNYLRKAPDGKVCIIYGLRRTGKTVMLFQAISGLPADATAYIKVLSSDNMAMLNRDLRSLSDAGIRYVFIDEITLMKDFTDSASLLSDIYAASGIKIVLSGTDSLGFALSLEDELYDRAYMIHTTFIPFREYSRLLGFRDVDEYIRYGGTFRMGDPALTDEDWERDEASFLDDESTRRYIDTSIARNIQHGLKGYKAGGHFRHLIDLYEAGELTNAINRLIEDMNHAFLLSVLERDFVSHDLGSYRQIERKRATALGENSILDALDEADVLQTLKHILDIKNCEERSVALSADHIREIKQYLYKLDLIVNVPSETIGGDTGMEHILFSQPGMRYCQAQALVYSLDKDKEFRKYPIAKRREIMQGILEEVRGRMLEEIVLLETMKALPKGKRAFKLLFDIGEFDMVICDEEKLECRVYEIKHSKQIHEAQYRHMKDEEKCAQVSHTYGEIKERTVLYNGDDRIVDGIRYRNVVSYLEQL